MVGLSSYEKTADRGRLSLSALRLLTIDNLPSYCQPLAEVVRRLST